MTTPVNQPNVSYKPYQEAIRLGSGAKKGMGFPSVEYQWNELSDDMRTQLRAYCASESGDAFIEFTDPEDEADTIIMSGKVHWPDEEDAQTNYRIGFTLLFTNLVVVT